jgi:hypothetical protein
MDNKTVVAMDFSKGVWNGKLVELANVVIDQNLVPMATSAGVKAGDVGAAIDTGIATQITAHQGEIGDALIAAVDDAFTRAKNHIESKSPSQKAGREIGLPIPQGIAQHILMGGPLVNDALLTVMNGGLAAARANVGAMPVMTPGGGSGSMWAPGGVTHNTSFGDTHLHFPESMTSFPRSKEEWHNAMQEFDEARRDWLGLNGKAERWVTRACSSGASTGYEPLF